MICRKRKAGRPTTLLFWKKEKLKDQWYYEKSHIPMMKVWINLGLSVLVKSLTEITKGLKLGKLTKIKETPFFATNVMKRTSVIIYQNNHGYQDLWASSWPEHYRAFLCELGKSLSTKNTTHTAHRPPSPTSNVWSK